MTTAILAKTAPSSALDPYSAAFAKRVDSFEIVGETVRRPNNTLRGFSALPIRVKRAALS